MKMLRTGLRLTIIVATASLSFGQQTTQEWRPNVHEVMIDFQVMLLQTKQFVPGPKSAQVRVFENDVQQKIERFNESSSARYKLTYSPIPGQDGNQRKIRVELVDDHGRPLIMQDERHRLLKYEITIDKSTGSQVPPGSAWRPNPSEDNKSATWAQTMDFVGNTTELYGSSVKVEATGECSLRISSGGSSYDIQMPHVDPLSIVVDQASFTISFSGTSNQAYRKCSQSTVVSCPDDVPLKGPMSFGMRDVEDAKRVARALMHAALLCGGTKPVSPF